MLLLGAVQCLGKAIDAIIVVSILQGARHVLVNIHIARHISPCVILGKALPANRTNRTNAFRTFANSLVKQAYVVPANAFEVSIGNDRCRMLANHAIAMSGTEPFGQPSAFLIYVFQPAQNLGHDVWIHQVEERKLCPERVPKSVVGIEDARHHAPIIGAVMQGVAPGIYLVELAREYQHAVKAGVEGAHVIVGAARNAHFCQLRIPYLFGLCFHLVEALVANFA